MPASTDRIGRKALAALSDDAVVAMIETAEPDDSARLLRRLPPRRRGAILARIAGDLRDDIADLSPYPDTVAGGLMNTRYADLDATMTCGDAIRQLASEDRAETVNIAFVVDGDHILLGSVSLRTLIKANRSTPVGAVMDRDVDAVDVNTPTETAARVLSHSGRPFLPVVDRDNRLVGILSFRDAFAELEEAASEDMQRFTAVTGPTGPGYLDLSVWRDFLRRAPWVLSLAIAGLMAGYVVHVYEAALEALVILALYMPMVADTGGNVGTQTSGLLIRAIATGEITLRNGPTILWREFRIGILLAAMLFAFAFLKVVFLSNNADVPFGLSLEMIAVAIGIAISVQVVSSVLLGAVLPIVAMALRLDPAVMAGPALTTSVDATGLVIYFVLTTTILGI